MIAVRQSRLWKKTLDFRAVLDVVGATCQVASKSSTRCFVLNFSLLIDAVNLPAKKRKPYTASRRPSSNSNGCWCVVSSFSWAGVGKKPLLRNGTRRKMMFFKLGVFLLETSTHHQANDCSRRKRGSLDSDTSIQHRECGQPGAPITMAAIFFTGVGVVKPRICC